MKTTKRTMGIIGSVLLLAACQKEMSSPPVNELNSLGDKNGDNTVGVVYTLSNETAGNKVIAYHRTSDGSLTWLANYPTGGTGTGMGLGNQGALSLGEDGILLAVNPGSNSITAFKTVHKELLHTSTISSGGMMPISITRYGNLVFVLNDGGTANISGFMLDAAGILHPIPGSARPLSAAMPDAAQISFTHGGAVVVITEKATNKLTTYTVNESGIPGIMHTLGSDTPTPFGFAATEDGIIYVSEAAGGAPGASVVSSYQVSVDGSITLIEGSMSAGQTAACWVALSNNGKYAYVTNTGSNTLSVFKSDAGGALAVAQAAVMTGAAPIDVALSNNSKFLYELNSGNETIGVFAVNNDGSTATIQTVGGLPDGATGVVAK